ncbi:MAG: 30S ribosomal protein S3 [Candidatus Vogelbacteria bacterium]|nr:30S ribosomal protein S3 [Candidatus Vogelbacteria bacterium]
MSHTVHPYAHRLGILRDWKSRWFGARRQYHDYLKSDVLLREYLEKRLRGFYVDAIEMERNESSYRIIVKTARPGMIIGRQGEGIQKLRTDIVKTLRRIRLVNEPKDIKIEIEEVRSPETHAAVVAAMIAESLEKRLPFRRVMKQTLEKVMASREVRGAKISLSGRLGGAEMSRHESLLKGQLPLQTLRADIDFARERAHMGYGDIGIKVWIYKGEIFSGAKDRSEANR